MNKFVRWTVRAMQAVGVALLVAGMYQFAQIGETATRNADAMIENILLPSQIEFVRSMRSGDTRTFTEGVTPHEIDQWWRIKVEKIVTSRAFARVVAAHESAKKSGVDNGFDRQRFIKSLSHPASAEDDVVFRRGAYFLYGEAAVNAAEAQEAERLQETQAFAKIAFGLTLLLWLSSTFRYGFGLTLTPKAHVLSAA